MDLFLTLRNFDPKGNEVLETGQQGTPVPVAKGRYAFYTGSSIPS